MAKRSKKVDAGLVALGILSFLILYTGEPFGNPMPLEEIWQWFWKMAFAGTILGLAVTFLKRKFEKWL